jgi:hypothetical protein
MLPSLPPWTTNAPWLYSRCLGLCPWIPPSTLLPLLPQLPTKPRPMSSTPVAVHRLEAVPGRAVSPVAVNLTQQMQLLVSYVTAVARKDTLRVGVSTLARSDGAGQRHLSLAELSTPADYRSPPLLPSRRLTHTHPSSFASEVPSPGTLQISLLILAQHTTSSQKTSRSSASAT